MRVGLVVAHKAIASIIGEEASKGLVLAVCSGWERRMVAARTKMEALVVARLMMGDITSWTSFESQRIAAGQIVNRRAARSVSSQIGRGYRELSREIQTFIDKNFLLCGYEELARLLPEIEVRSGLSIRLDEFEKKFFPLAQSVKRRIPAYAHVNISTFGLQFEYPEHHFLRDLETSLPELLETRSRLATFAGPDFNSRRDRDIVAPLVAKEKFLSRSIISASFSLAEAFLSGLFFSAVHLKSIGRLHCDEDFTKFAANKESAPLRDRLDRVVRFSSEGTESGNDVPFKPFIEIGKRYRDAIHHTTPFQRKDVELGGRLAVLYEISGEQAIQCVALSIGTLLKITRWINPQPAESEIAVRCHDILQIALTGGPGLIVQEAEVA
ncbi:MAG: hypothetical protein ACK5S0_00225 [bacterium]|jgi:hypothetical protein